jgi:GR25 family glycosyltransferase involved in LPS biosynthesis
MTIALICIELGSVDFDAMNPQVFRSVNALVDAVYVLSVRGFADRIAHVKRELARHRIEFEFVFEHDADVIPDALIERRFAPSDLSRGHQSLDLKHIETWERAVARGQTRTLVFEDDVVLAEYFPAAFARAMQEADALKPGWAIYLGRGDNTYIGRGDVSTALVPGGELPATDALVFDLEAARRRLACVNSRRITRPADWLMRETDAAVAVAHWWLSRPIVEQGSMSGKFASVLDDKRRGRGRAYAWLRYRWDKLWRGLRHGRAGRRHADARAEEKA